MCDKDNGWQKPSLLECVSNSFLVLQGRVSVYISTNGCNSFDFIFENSSLFASQLAEKDTNSTTTS